MRKYHGIITDIHPKSLLPNKNTLTQEFDNKFEFIKSIEKHSGDYTSQINQFKKEVNGDIDVDRNKAETIKNEVRNNLIKRGIITGSVYEGYRYGVEGEIIDYAELAAGNSHCVMTPIKKHDKWFYELYVNMSIPWSVQDDEINEGAIRLVETIKLLEELNVEIKINIILYSRRLFKDGRDYLFILPLASHSEYKDYESIYPFMTSNFLRGPLFETMRSHGETVANLGQATKLENALNLWEIEETELAQRVIKDLDLKL